MREVFQQLMRILRIILTQRRDRLLNVLLFLTPKQKELQSFKLKDLLPETNLILGYCFDSQALSVSKNKCEELEFFNKTESDKSGFSYLDFILDPSTNYVIHVQLK